MGWGLLREGRKDFLGNVSIGVWITSSFFIHSFNFHSFIHWNDCMVSKEKSTVAMFKMLLWVSNLTFLDILGAEGLWLLTGDWVFHSEAMTPYWEMGSDFSHPKIYLQTCTGISAQICHNGLGDRNLHRKGYRTYKTYKKDTETYTEKNWKE